ncbi:MAG: tryptophan--tRNA ligase [Acidimicrobiia bacterium]|nr:tryptophan--tRNA ligase [Acidimicrobiia bacterium]
MSTKQRVFSGVQPTGEMHIGTYLGAFRNWVRLQDEYDTIYCIVDQHAITLPQDPDDLRRNRIAGAKVLLATGIDPERALVYAQSYVPQHAELSWLLGVMTPMGVLNRMTQYKDRLAQGHAANLGLFSYPVLMAADILIHRANLVPVGDDQKQHLEMTRDLAERFNNRYGDIFPIPEPLIPETAARVMSLADPTSKMSKSDENVRSRVGIVDPPDVVVKRIKSAMTDSEPTVRYDPEHKAGISNLLEIMSAATGRSIDDLVAEFGDSGYGTFKLAVADALVDLLTPIRERYNELDDGDIVKVLADGAERAEAQAEHYMREVRTAIGLNKL